MYITKKKKEKREKEELYFSTVLEADASQKVFSFGSGYT